MDDERLRQRSALYAQALERDPATLESWLASLPPDDAAAVRRLLASTGDSATEGRHSLGGMSARRYAKLLSSAMDEEGAASAQAGECLGAWRLESRIGQGGMGEVWLATRADGLYSGRAAIKLLRSDLDRGRVAQRFAREREVLARLDHPNIARLLDAGLSERDERPYLVLEHVSGTSLLDYVRSNECDTRERVRLVRCVAEAVAHAHGRLVVHRDLKPSNILVTAARVPKVLDFGIAGLLDDDGEQGDSLTRAAGRALTLEYSAPEQVTGAPTDVRTDIFTLGIVLFELLDGQRPFAPREPTRRALEYAIVHDDARALDPKRFDAGLAAVVAKSLGRDPERRYATMAAFADDLGRWLDHRPVSAASPGAFERVGMWARRNRALAAASAATALAVAAGLTVSIWLAGEAREQEQIAVAALADAEQQALRAKSALARAESESARAERESDNARQQAALATREGENAKLGEAKALAAEADSRREKAKADLEARKATAVSGFLVELFQAADPEKAKGEKLTARDVIDTGAENLGKRFAGQPDTLAELQRVLGTTYASLQRADKAVPLLTAAAQAQDKAHGRNSLQRARILLTLARAEVETEKFPEAVGHYREALPLVERADGRVGESVVLGKLYLSYSLCKTAQPEACMEMVDAVGADVRAGLGERHWLYAEAQNSRATALSILGRWREMPAVLEPIEPIVLDPPPGKLADALTIRGNLAISMARGGNLTGAIARLGPLTDDLAAYLGPEAERTLVHRWFLAEYQRQSAHYSDCAAQYAKLVEIRTRLTGASHPLTIDVMSKAATCARSANDPAAARTYFDRALAALPETDAPPQRSVLRALLVLANVALDSGERQKAAMLLARAERLVAALKLETSDEWITLMVIQGHALLAAGDVAGAAAKITAGFATPTGQRALGGHTTRAILAYHLALAGQEEKARVESAAARKLAASRLQADHPFFAALDYVDSLNAAPEARAAALAALERSARRPATLPLAPLWFLL